VPELPSPYAVTQLLFPYAWGARYLHLVAQTGGTAAVQHRFTVTPTDTHTLMASRDRPADRLGAPGTVFAPAAPQGWTLIDENRLGAWGTFLLLAKLGGDVDRARELALGWMTDGFFLFDEGGGAATALVWRIELADAQTAQAVTEVAETLLGSNGVRRLETSVIIAKNDSGQPLDWAFLQ
jgi:hypothetical protein